MVSSRDADLNGYRSLHMYIQYKLGTPKKCSHCGKEGGDKRYHWANISGEYKRDLDDWIRLCPKCHFKFDKRTLGGIGQEQDFCRKGHPLSGTNLSIQRTGKSIGKRRCITCQRIYFQAYKQRRLNKEIK